MNKKHLRQIIREEIKKVLKETYYNPEWKLTTIQDWIKTYAMNNRLNFNLIKKVVKKSGTGSKTTFYVYDIGDKHGIVIKDDKVAGAPRLSEIDVIVGLKGSALGSLSKSYTISGTDGSQQELIKLLDKVLGIKEGQELTEGNIMIFSYAKPYKKPDVSKIRAEADKYIKFLQSKNFNVHTGSDALYFPNFVWAGGKQQLGECIGVLAGSETIVVSPIGENKVFKFGESLLARFVKDDRIPAFLIKGSMEEGRQQSIMSMSKSKIVVEARGSKRELIKLMDKVLSPINENESLVKSKWNQLDIDSREDLLLRFVKNPDNAVKLASLAWDRLPDSIAGNKDFQDVISDTSHSGFTGGVR